MESWEERVCYLACTRLKNAFSTMIAGRFRIHGVGGLLGAILTGICESHDEGGKNRWD